MTKEERIVFLERILASIKSYESLGIFQGICNFVNLDLSPIETRRDMMKWLGWRRPFRGYIHNYWFLNGLDAVRASVTINRITVEQWYAPRIAFINKKIKRLKR